MAKRQTQLTRASVAGVIIGFGKRRYKYANGHPAELCDVLERLVRGAIRT